MDWSIEQGMVVRRTGDGPELLWIHGLGHSSLTFDPVIAAMPHYRHVLVDLPGYGRSPWPADGASVETLDGVADHLARWLALAPMPPVVIGHSMGGVIGTLLAERAPLRALVDVEGALTRADCKLSSQAAAYTLDDFRTHGFTDFRTRIFEGGADRPALRGYYASLRFASPLMFHRHATDLVALADTNTLAPRLAALRLPTLYIAGVPDGTTAPSLALLDRHHVRWLPIEPATHFVYLDQLPRFVNELDLFLDDLPAEHPTPSEHAVR